MANVYLRVELDAFGLIAKEGCKYGLTICIATQRPRDIPQDALSQMGTLIVHRLINDRYRLYGILSIQEFKKSDYDLPEGDSANGMTCQLQLVDQSLVIVGYGAVFWSVGCNWEVVEINEVFESITIKRA